MICLVIGLMLVAQLAIVAWLFFLDQEYKALNRYVQGLRVPTGYGFDAKTGREFPCDKDGSEINAQFRRMAVEFDKLEKDYLAATANDPDPERQALRSYLMAKRGDFA